MDKKDFLKKIRDFRESKDLSMKEVAAKMNLSQNTYGRKERGERRFRDEELKKLTHIIDGLFKEEESHQNTNKKSSQEGMKTEIDLLESILCIISNTLAIESNSIYYMYESKYPEIPYPYSEFIKNTGGMASPEDAINNIKSYVKEYQMYIADPKAWDDKETKWLREVESGMNILDEKGNPIGDDERERGIQNDIAAGCWDPLFGKEEYENFKDKDDEWLKEFVTNEENYNFVYFIIGGRGGNLIYQSPEDQYKAFKDMIKAEPLLHVLLQLGLLEESWFNKYWEKWQQEINPDSESIDGEQIRKKLKEIFVKNNQRDYLIPTGAVPYN
jgi:transcriptional regulator with XRE-family HTH domain